MKHLIHGLEYALTYDDEASSSK